MTSKWPEVSLADIYDIRSGLSKPASAFGSGYPFLSFKEVFGNYFVPDELMQLVESSDKERANGSIKRGDVFLTRTSETMHELGMSSVALKDYENATFNGFTKRLRPKEGTPYEVHPEFVGYYFRSPRFRTNMLAFSTLSTRASLNNDMISRLTLPLPSFNIQMKMAKILKCLDDKISLNTETNQTLEKMAQAIFKSWFVDFDPVKAKMNGEQPEGMDAATASLFPEKFVESEKGLIPDGWKIAQVKELCKLVQNGGTPKRKESDYWIDGTINWFTTSELSDSPLIESKEKISELGLAKSSVKMWPKGTVLIAIYAAPTVGRLGILSQEAGSNQACTGLIPKTNEVGHYLFNSLYFARGWLNNISVGAAQQNISKGIVESLEIVIPSDELIESFGCHVETLWQKRLQLQKESQCLANLRDILLPKLLSGEIDLETTIEN
ncbi:hypothetical protein BCV02_01290 [Vibrio breoganii]|uniref:restriction endonuclease subunit S n=1 Tax=Vibrio breoganii TaxID=553239 RepID=UPI000C85D50D|nr:restriction endonuclease subunit S [Vibrio breoganii]PMG03944.1 hypothetical protein BCV02_01290 [Vibrio breoganii]